MTARPAFFLESAESWHAGHQSAGEENCLASKHACSDGLRRCIRKVHWIRGPGPRGAGVAPARSEGTLPASQVPEHIRHAEGESAAHPWRKGQDATRPRAYTRDVGAVLGRPSQHEIWQAQTRHHRRAPPVAGVAPTECTAAVARCRGKSAHKT